MDFRVSRDGTAVTVSISGEFDAKTTPAVRDEVDALIASAPSKVTVDLSQLRLIDSTGVGVVVSLFKRTRAGGGSFEVTGLNGQPKSIFELLRLDRVFGL